MRTIKLKAIITYTVNIEQDVKVSEEDNRVTLHNKAKELALIGIESNPNMRGEVSELYIADIDSEGNPIIWVRP